MTESSRNERCEPAMIEIYDSSWAGNKFSKRRYIRDNEILFCGGSESDFFSDKQTWLMSHNTLNQMGYVVSNSGRSFCFRDWKRKSLRTMYTRKLIIWLCYHVFVVLGSIYISEGLLFNLSSNNNFAAGISGSAETIQNAMRELKMIYYNGSSNASSSYDCTFEQSKDLIRYMNLSKPLVLYIHGYEEHPSNESIQTIVSAYLQRGSENIVVLDWSAFAFGNYISVAVRTKDISRYTANMILDLVRTGMKNDSLHVVGHSLGAHIAGFMGKYLNFTIPRVTGLDPANPLFYQFNADHINEKSGQLVDIIHTDGGFYGAYPPTGSVDFFANGGIRPQPGCHLFGVPLSPRGLCSHWRSWRFYAESVVNNTAFPAVRCSSYKSFRQGACNNNEIVYFGYAMTKNVSSGNYYFLTNDRYPFGRGLDGIRRN